MTLEEIKNYFPVVFGHFGIAVAVTTLYAPYMEQTILIFVYVLLALVLTSLNWYRKVIGTRVVWGLMCAIISFLLLTGVLEAGQANYNKNSKECFLVYY